MIMPIGQLIMAQVAGPKRMGRVMGIVAMPAMLAPILGPVLGGAILEYLHWSWIFLVNVPIGVIAFVLGWRMLPHTDSGHAGRLDVLGLALMSSASTALVYGLSELATNSNLTAPLVVWPVVAGVVLAGVFCWHALRVERPLLDVRLYANRVFAAASLTTFGLGAALFGAMILVPLYYQEVRHESVIVTGLLTGPQGIGMLLVMPLAGRLSDRFGGGRVALAGVSVLSLATVPLAFIGAGTSIVSISLVLVLRGVGIGFSFMPAMTAAFASLRPAAAARRDPPAERPAAHRRRDRNGGARRRAAARGHPRALARQGRRRVRHRLLVVVRDLPAVADPLSGAAPRREPTRATRPRGSQRGGGRRAARRIDERAMSSPAIARADARPRQAARHARGAADRPGHGVSPRLSQLQPAARARHAPGRRASSATPSSSC